MSTPRHESARRFTRRRAIATGITTAMLPPLAGPANAQESPPGLASSGVTPDSVSAALEQLPGLAQALLDKTGLPGMAVGVVYQDEARLLEGFGVRDIDNGGDIDADTAFQIASLSKPVASTIVAALIGEGHLTWDTRIADIDPGFALNDPWVTANVTVADLFSHRSGLPGHAGDTLEDLCGTREEVLHGLRFIDPKGAFRASYAYTNFGLTAAAVAAATAAGGVWEDVAVDRLFQPAGMTRTTSRYADFVATENRAAGHVRRNGTWQHLFDRQPDAQSPAGGVSSTVRDLCQWLRLQLGAGMLDGERIVAAEPLALTHRPFAVSTEAEDPTTQPVGFYGLGWNVRYDAEGDIVLSHSGAFAMGTATAVFLLPQHGLGIVALTNGEPMGIPEALAISFLDLCRTGAVNQDYLALIGPIIEAQAIPEYGTGVAAAPATVLPAAAAGAYVGEYGNGFYGPLAISADGDELVMTLGPDRVERALTHYNRDVFTYEPVGENAGRPSAVTFTLGAEGVAVHVVVENLDLYGAGTFTREGED